MFSKVSRPTLAFLAINFYWLDKLSAFIGPSRDIITWGGQEYVDDIVLIPKGKLEEILYDII